MAETPKPEKDTRTKILDAARDLFVSLGYARVTMRRIAQKIGYTPTTIYLHFKDKEAMLRELVANDFFAMTARFREIAAIADPGERLRATGMAYVEYGLAYPNHYRLIFLTNNVPVLEECAILNDQQRGNPEYDAYAFLTHTVAACIETGYVRPEYRDVEQTAQMLWSAVHGVVSLYISKSHDTWLTWKPPLDTARLLIDTLTRGILVPPDEIAALDAARAAASPTEAARG
jgi:AcrR family transcriptional regulator